MRLLKLWLIINETKLVDIKEKVPLPFYYDQLPVKIKLTNGFHTTKTLLVTTEHKLPYYISIGCRIDNGQLVGALLYAGMLFGFFFVAGGYFILLIANLPLIYICYVLFAKPKDFIVVKVERFKNK